MKSSKVYFLAAGLLLICLALPAMAEWRSLSLAEPHYFLGWRPSHSMAWDPNNEEFVVAYGGDRLYVARGTGDQWEIEIVDETLGTGMATSLAIPNEDFIHVSYYDRANEDLRYAVNDGSGWETQLVRDQWDSGSYNSIAVYQDQVYIAFQQITDIGTEYLHASHYDGSEWSHFLVDSVEGCGYEPWIAVDSSGNPGIAYRCYFDINNNDLRYSSFTGTNYSPEVIKSGSSLGYGPSLAFNASNRPVIAYYENGSTNLAAWDGFVWGFEQIEALAEVTGLTNQLFIDEYDATILTTERNSDAVRVYTKDTTWTYEELFYNADSRPMFSGAFDPTGGLSVVFMDLNLHRTGRMMALYPEPTKAWSEHELDRYSQTGKGLAIDLSPQDMPMVSYIGPSHEMIFRWDGKAWLDETIDDLGYNIYYTGLTFGPDNIPTVVYKNSSDKLMLAAFNQKGWDTEMIDLPLGVRDSVKVKSDLNGDLHVVHTDASGAMNYVYQASGNVWTQETIEPGSHCWLIWDMAVDSNRATHVVYYDWNVDAMHYATNASGIWNIASFPGVNLANISAIALDGDNQVYIAYSDSTDDSIYLKYDDGTKAWADKLVRTDVSVSDLVGLEIDMSGGLHLSYVNNLKELVYAYAADINAAFTETVIDSFINTSDGKSDLALNQYGNPFIAYTIDTFGRTRLAFDLLPPELGIITPDEGEQGEMVGVSIKGASLFAVSDAFLTNSKGVIPCLDLVNPEWDSVSCELDLSDAELGLYDLVILAANGEVTLTDAFEVLEPTGDDDDDDDDDDDNDDDNDDRGGDDDDDDSCGC